MCVRNWWGLCTPLGLLGFRFKCLNLGGQHLDTLNESVVKVDDSGGFAQVEFGELDAETLDGRVGQVSLLSLDDSDFLFEVFDASIDVIDVDFVHVLLVFIVGYLLCYQERDEEKNSLCSPTQLFF